MQKILKVYDNLSIKLKFIYVILLNLILFGSACIVGQGIANRANQKLLYNTLATSLSYSAMEIRDSLKEIEDLSFHIITDAIVQEQLAEVKRQPEDMVIRSKAYRQLNTLLQNYYAQNGFLYYISLIGEDIRTDTNTIWAEKISEAIREKFWETAVEAEGRARWVYQEEANNPLFLVRSVQRIEPYWLDTLGIISISVNMEKLVEGSADFSGRFGENFYLLSDGDNLLFQTDNFPEDIGSELEWLDENDYKIVKLGANRYFAVVGTVPDYEWKYVHLILYNDMYRAVTDSLILYIMVVVFGAIISLIFCERLVKRLTKHISILIDKMQEFGHNNEKFSVKKYDYSDRKDELGLLHRKFDEMALEILSLIQNDYTNQLLMKDARLKALEAQIDPHFLYNVLQSISWSAKEIGDTQIPKMVDALGKMLRTTLSPEDEEFTIGKEMEFVGNYMTIQKFRFEGQLDFKANIPELLKHVRIPKLTIQPLVENAIRYAMESCEEVCFIEVIGEIREEEIIISVRNSGSAFEPELLSKLKRKQIKPNGFGIGILNIDKRLLLFGGEEAYLQLINEDGMAVARIHIPNKYL